MMTPRRAFSVLELSVALAMAGIIAIAAASLFPPIYRIVRQTDGTAALNAGAAAIDDHLRVLIRNLGGGSLHPGNLIAVKSNTGAGASDELVIVRAVGNGVFASSVTGGAGAPNLIFNAVTAEAGVPQCPLIALTADPDPYLNAVTLFGSQTPVALLIGDDVFLYEVDGAGLVIDTVPFQRCNVTLTLAAGWSPPSSVVGNVALFPVRVEHVHMVGTVIPAPLVVKTRTPNTRELSDPIGVISPPPAELWPEVFDFQVQLGFDANDNGIIASSEWDLATGCASGWPACLTKPRLEMRAVRFGVVLGALSRRDGVTSTAHVFSQPDVSSTTHTLRPLHATVMLRNGANQ